LRDRGCVVRRCFSDFQLIHELTLSFCALAFYTSLRRNAA
jgi:hypothetical protein